MIGERTRIVDATGEVVSVEHVGGDIVEMSVRLPELAARVRPGQFAQLRIADAELPLLRRPFSIAWTAGDLCSFVFAPVGRGTRALAALAPGDLIEALGPLGRGFDLDAAAATAVLVSGGLGCAPFPFLARELRARGVAVTIVSGAAAAPRLYPAERFRRGDAGIGVIEATDDGSHGRRGRVTEHLDGLVGPATAVYACGPNVMVAALARWLSTQPQPPRHAAASLEAPMGCGFGTCLGCALPVERDGAIRWLLCCSDGPVFELGEIAWDELLALPGADVA